MSDSTTVARRRSPSRWAIALVLIAHTVAGVAGGMAIEHAILHRHGPMGFGPAGFGRERPTGRDSLALRREMEGRMAGQLARELDLDATQRMRLDSLMPLQSARFQALRHDFDPRLQALLDSSSVEIEAILRPDQVTRWQEIRRRMRPGEGPPPGR
jgi:hypothetical protein